MAKGAIERLAERLGLDLSREVGKLSKGNKQKVGLIQAFMHEPELLILDEPTSGLDPLATGVCSDLGRQRQRPDRVPQFARAERDRAGG